MKASAADGHPSGFTLLELLVALTVLSFVVVGLAQGFHFGLLAWSAEVRLTSGNDELDTLDRTLRHVIESADPGDDVDPAPFVGARDHLDCITALPNSGPTYSRRMQATLLVDAHHRLVLRWRPYMHAMRLRPPQRPTDTELLRGVSRIELAFWRPSTGWVSTWRLPELPWLVRVRLLFESGDQRHWPDIVAAPMLDRT